MNGLVSGTCRWRHCLVIVHGSAWQWRAHAVVSTLWSNHPYLLIFSDDQDQGLAVLLKLVRKRDTIVMVLVALRVRTLRRETNVYVKHVPPKHMFVACTQSCGIE